MNGPSVDAFSAASRFFVDVVRAVPSDAWSRAGLGSWSVLQLVAHANRAHTTVEEYLLQPRAPEPAGSAYFSEEAIAERGRAAVAALGDDPLLAVATASDRAISLVGKTAAEAVVAGPAGTTTLAVYLPTRTAELTIHGLDIIGATGTEVVVPPEALTESLHCVTDRVIRQGNGPVALLALTGRQPLPPGFSAY
jgi:uncharacterized protein (TIGR03083 family)